MLSKFISYFILLGFLLLSIGCNQGTFSVSHDPDSNMTHGQCVEMLGNFLAVNTTPGKLLLPFVALVIAMTGLATYLGNKADLQLLKHIAYRRRTQTEVIPRHHFSQQLQAGLVHPQVY